MRYGQGIKRITVEQQIAHKNIQNQSKVWKTRVTLGVIGLTYFPQFKTNRANVAPR